MDILHIYAGFCLLVLFAFFCWAVYSFWYINYGESLKYKYEQRKIKNPPPLPKKEPETIAHETLNMLLHNKNIPKMSGFFGSKLEDYSKEDLIRIAEYLFFTGKF